MTTGNQTDKQLESLRIEPDRKLPKRSGKLGIVLLLVGIAIGIGVSTVISPPQAAESDPAKAAAATAKPAAPAEPKPGDVMLTATGYVTPRRRIALSPQVIGQVVWVGVEKGDEVKKDQVLVRLDDSDYQATLRQRAAETDAAKARYRRVQVGPRVEEIQRAQTDVRQFEAELKQAESTLARVRSAVEDFKVETRQRLDEAIGARDALIERTASARSQLAELQAGSRVEDLEEAKAALAAAEAAQEYARIQLDDTVIKAPSDGTVLEKLIEVGELVSPQNFGGTRGARTELLSIANLSELQVEVDINEADFKKIRMNAAAKVFLDAYPETGYDGFIREIAPEADRQKATVQVKVAIKNADQFVRPEMSARVDFLLAAE